MQRGRSTRRLAAQPDFGRGAIGPGGSAARSPRSAAACRSGRPHRARSRAPHRRTRGASSCRRSGCPRASGCSAHRWRSGSFPGTIDRRWHRRRPGGCRHAAPAPRSARPRQGFSRVGAWRALRIVLLPIVGERTAAGQIVHFVGRAAPRRTHIFQHIAPAGRRGQGVRRMLGRGAHSQPQAREKE